MSNLFSTALMVTLIGLMTGCSTQLHSPSPSPVPDSQSLPTLSSPVPSSSSGAISPPSAPNDMPQSPATGQISPDGREFREIERGHASWYGPRFHGRRTASGERYDQTAMTAAHKTLPFGSLVRVRSLVTGKEIDVRINDRGPFLRGRVIDVSKAAAEALGMTSLGVKQVLLLVPASGAGPRGSSAPIAVNEAQ